MKVIFFNMDVRLNRHDTHAVISETFIPYSEENVAYAAEHSADGKYRIGEVAEPESAVQPTQFDAIEAQVTYMAMMTDTLLEV